MSFTIENLGRRTVRKDIMNDIMVLETIRVFPTDGSLPVKEFIEAFNGKAITSVSIVNDCFEFQVIRGETDSEKKERIELEFKKHYCDLEIALQERKKSREWLIDNGFESQVEELEEQYKEWEDD